MFAKSDTLTLKKTAKLRMQARASDLAFIVNVKIRPQDVGFSQLHMTTSTGYQPIIRVPAQDLDILSAVVQRCKRVGTWPAVCGSKR